MSAVALASLECTGFPDGKQSVGAVWDGFCNDLDIHSPDSAYCYFTQ